MNAFCGRITKPYSDLSGVFMDWTTQCGYLFVYEHEADEKVNRTHCHFLCIDSQRDNKGVKNVSSYKKLCLKGNQDHSYKVYDPQFDGNHRGEWYEYIKYMTKGTLEPKLVFGDNALGICELSKSKWVDIVTPIKEEVKEKKEKFDEWELIKKDFVKEWLIDDKFQTQQYLTAEYLDLVRRWTMRWYWHKYGRFPIASVYKRNAISLYYMLMETMPQLEELAMNKILDWY